MTRVARRSAERLADIADLLGDRAFTRAGPAQLRPDLVRRDLAVRPIVPGDVERLEPALGRPHVVADHGHEIVEHHDLSHPGNRSGPTIIYVSHFAAEHGAGRERCELDARWHRIDAVLRPAVGLVRGVQTLERSADQAESSGSLSGGSFGGSIAAARQTRLP